MCASRSHLNRHFIGSAVLLMSLLACSAASAAEDAATTKEKPMLIDTNAAAKPTEDPEARIALRQHREATVLNRFTFPGNVLQGIGDHVDNWIVMFCPAWNEKCQSLLPSYELLGVSWENKLNKAVMSSSVRFAKVDCATDKGLCVSLDVVDYPSVVHYRNGERVALWEGGAPGLVRFVKQQLEPPKPKRRPSIKDKNLPKNVASCDAAGSLVDQSVEGVQPWPVVRSVCFALVLVAAAHCAYMLVSRARISLSGRLTKSTPQLARSPLGILRSDGMRQISPLKGSIVL